jgi:hypothetical protein
MPTVVVVPLTCHHCGEGIEIECSYSTGFSDGPNVHVFQCPHCRRWNHEQLPGDIESVRWLATRNWPGAVV